MSRRKQYYKQGIAVLLMALIVLAAIGYGNGLFDLSFATRTPTSQTGDPSTPQPDWSLPEEGDTLPSDVTSADQLAVLPSLYDGLAARLALTEATYSSYSTPLHLAGLGYGTRLPFSQRMTTVATEVRVPLGTGAAYRSELVHTSVEKPLFELYMGYMLYENGSDCHLYGGMGELLLTDFCFQPAYARDSAGHPLFLLEGRYFYYDEETDRMHEAVYDETVLPLATGISYNAPVETPYVRFCENGKWGYKLRKTGEVVIDAIYTHAFNFVKNNDPAEDRPAFAYLAVVIVGEVGHIRIINTEGVVVVDAYTSCDYTLLEGNSLSTFEAWDGCYLPERADNIGAVGMDQIDEYGVLRVRRRIVRKANRDVVPVDEDMLLRISRNGDNLGYHATYFSVPTGYQLCAYTEGVLLLKEQATGKYGYYSVEGYWLTAPVFLQASPVREGLAAVKTADGNMGLLSAAGEWVLLPTFRYVSEVSGGSVLVYDTELGWRLLCKLGTKG